VRSSAEAPEKKSSKDGSTTGSCLRKLHHCVHRCEHARARHNAFRSSFLLGVMPQSQPSDTIADEKWKAHAARSAFPTIPLERTTSLQTSTRPNSSRSDNDALLHPGTIKINVQGAFIDDELPNGSATPSPALPPQPDEDGFEYKHDTNDIRLPNQAAVVSHVAVDVGSLPSAMSLLQARTI